MAEVMNLTKEDLERMKSVDIKTVDKDTLVDINLVKIDESLPRRDYKNEPEGIEELMPWSEMIQQRCRIESKS